MAYAGINYVAVFVMFLILFPIFLTVCCRYEVLIRVENGFSSDIFDGKG